MFGQVKVQLAPALGQSTQPFVSERAVQQIGTETVVFKVVAPSQYRKQVVKLGKKLTDGYLVEQGIKAGEQVVGEGSFILKAELLKRQSAIPEGG
jgi:cobalt-zinc-cadmium efflux system membrane fusion protein